MAVFFFEKKMNLNKNLKTHKIQYFTTLMAVTGVLKFLKKYTTNKKLNFLKERKAYYSFMPYDLRKIVIKNLTTIIMQNNFLKIACFHGVLPNNLKLKGIQNCQKKHITKFQFENYLNI